MPVPGVSSLDVRVDLIPLPAVGIPPQPPASSYRDGSRGASPGLPVRIDVVEIGPDSAAEVPEVGKFKVEIVVAAARQPDVG